jgi:hypothetical protein
MWDTAHRQLENVRPFQIKRDGNQISEYALTQLVRDSEVRVRFFCFSSLSVCSGVV